MMAMAFLPLVVALFLLVILRQSSLRAGLVTLAITLLIVAGVPAFSLDGSRMTLAAEQGMSTSLTVLTILWPGFLLYHLIGAAGGLSVAARALTRLCPDRDLRLLLFVLGLCPCIEAGSGFGLGIVVIVPLLLELGCDPAQAAMLSILGQLTTTWGAVGVATLLGAELSGLPAPMLGARSALLLAPVFVGFGLLALVIGGGTRAARRALLPAILAGSLLTLGEWAWSQFPGVDLAGLLSSLSVLAFLAAWGWRKGHRLAMASHAHAHDSETATGTGTFPHTAEQAVTGPSLWRVFTPYLFLLGGLLLIHLLTSLLHVSGLLFLTSPGVWVAGAAVLAWPLLRIDSRQGRTALVHTLRQFVPVAGAMSSFLVTSALMQQSGMTSAIGSAAAALGSYFLWVSPWLGAFSGWMTGSVVGGNAMFVLLQQTAAARSALPLDWIVAAQNATCSIGRMLSPPILILAASTAQLPKGEGLLVRKMGIPVLAAVLAICLVLVGIVTFSLMVPTFLAALFAGCVWLLPSVVQVKTPVQAEHGV